MEHVDDARIQSWASDMCPFSSASLLRLLDTSVPFKTSAIYLSTDQQKPAADKDIVNALAKRGIAVQLGAADDILQDIWASVESDFHFGNPSSSCDGLIAQWRAHAGKPAATMYPAECFSGYFGASPDVIAQWKVVAYKIYKTRSVKCIV